MPSKTVVAGLTIAIAVIVSATIWVSIDRDDSASALEQGSGIDDPSTVKYVFDRALSSGPGGSNLSGIPDSIKAAAMNYGEALTIVDASNGNGEFDEREVILYLFEGEIDRLLNNILQTRRVEPGYI